MVALVERLNGPHDSNNATFNGMLRRVWQLLQAAHETPLDVHVMANYRRRRIMPFHCQDANASARRCCRHLPSQALFFAAGRDDDNYSVLTLVNGRRRSAY